MKNNIFNPKPLTLGIQILGMQHYFPQFHYSQNTWTGTLQPTEKSPFYKVRIHYNMPKPPRVFVLEPELVDDAPHRYSDHSLCLYYPKDHSWTSDQYISKTIVPWASLWLFFYEKWITTGKRWLGPEVIHNGVKKLI